MSTIEDHRLTALEATGLLGTPHEERFDRVTRLCRRLFDVPVAFVALVGREELWLKSAQGLGDASCLPRSETFCSFTVDCPEGLVVPDARQDQRFADLPTVVGEPFLRFYAGVPLRAPGGQIVGTLCLADTEPRAFAAVDMAVLRDLGSMVQKELSTDEELDRAAEVQRALFPPAPPVDSRWEVAGACRPSREVGGDFYDWHPSPEGTVVALGDVMGKGMPAAIVMASVRSALRVGAHRRDLGQTLQHAAVAVSDDLQATQSFATVLLARLEVGGWVACADAGHGHVAVVRANGTVEVVDRGGLPLGIDLDEQYLTHELLLDRGDLLLVHSDGLIELEGGPTSTREAGEILAGAPSAQEGVTRLLGLLDATGAPSDDVTVVVVRRR